MDLTLVILAAGKGTRFGGDKPLAAVGPNGESLYEYSVQDAVDAGFNRVIFVVSPKQSIIAYSERLAKYKNLLTTEFVVQDNDKEIDCGLNTGKERSKPWGTGHALLMCRTAIDTPFVVINADDYYGPSNFQQLGDFLKQNISTPDVAALPGYILKNTLSNSGGVNRGICTVAEDGYLQSISEHTNISLSSGALHSDNSLYGDETISMNAQVSMTFWGFYPEFFTLLKSAFNNFLNTTSDLKTDEFYIPAAVEFSINAGLLRVKVFPSAEQWRGITYSEDVVNVREFLRDLPSN